MRKILYITSLLTETYQLVWVVCRRDTAQYYLSMEDEANRHDTLYGRSTKGEELYRLEAQKHLHIHGIPVPATVNNALYTGIIRHIQNRVTKLNFTSGNSFC